MSGDGKSSGNGSSSPFGNGQGGQAGQTMSGHDFVKDPTGGYTGTGNDFIEKPAGAGATAEAPPDFTQGGKGPQKADTGADLDKESEGGSLLPLNAADVPAGSPRAPFIDNGTTKPFSVRG